MRLRSGIPLALVCALAFGISLRAQDLASFEKRTTVKVLPNGLTLIVCERPEAPVFSYYTLVDAGSADDPQGQSGLAHMFEHMAFKGTDTIGTRDYADEKVALAKVEDAYAAYLAERDKPVGQDEQKLKQLGAERDQALAEARAATTEKVNAGKVEIEQSVAMARRQIEAMSGELSEQIVRAVMPAGTQPEAAQ